MPRYSWKHCSSSSQITSSPTLSCSSSLCDQGNVSWAPWAKQGSALLIWPIFPTPLNPRLLCSVGNKAFHQESSMCLLLLLLYLTPNRTWGSSFFSDCGLFLRERKSLRKSLPSVRKAVKNSDFWEGRQSAGGDHLKERRGTFTSPLDSKIWFSMTEWLSLHTAKSKLFFLFPFLQAPVPRCAQDIRNLCSHSSNNYVCLI